MSAAATRARSEQDNQYIIDLRKLDEIHTTIDYESYDGNKFNINILQGNDFHGIIRGVFEKMSDKSAIGPFQFFKLLTETEIHNCKPYDLPEGEVEQFILNRMESSQQNTFLARLKLLFSDRFQTNYLDALIYPLCKQAHAVLVHSYILKSSIITTPINSRVHGRAHLTEMARYNSIFCGTYSDGSHFTAYMVVMPWEEGQSDGYILIFNPIHQPPDPGCLKDVSDLAKFIAHVKLNSFPKNARFMPRMHVVHVHHPKELTQNHADYPIDSCCNFWSAIILKMWLNFYTGTCRRSVSLFLTHLKKMFIPGTSGMYDYFTVNHTFTVARNPDYTMASVRVYTALYLQQFYQHDDLKAAIKGLDIEAETERLGGTEILSYEKTKQILNDYWTPRSGMSYVMAGHADAYERYMMLVTRFKSIREDERITMLTNMSRLDMFRIIYSMFDKRTESSGVVQNEFYEDFMKRILICRYYKESSTGKNSVPRATVELKPGWSEIPYECPRALAFNLEDVRLVSRDDKGKPSSSGDGGQANPSIDLSRSDDEEAQHTDVRERRKKRERKAADGDVIKLDDDDD